VAGKKTEPPQILALDTSCLIALTCGWHQHHAVTTTAIEQRLGAGARLAIAAPALVEAYSVLTRLPAPYRLAPRDALQLLSENFQRDADAVALNAQEHWSLLTGAPAAGIQGGRTYDALIAACARKAKARELLTLNLRHFEPFADDTLRIGSPL
jgi:predicted nucleic acid-binding protein